MTTDMLTKAMRDTRTAPAGTTRRIVALARAEALLLRRNPMALFNAFVVPAALVLFVRSGLPPDSAERLSGATIVTSLTAFTLLSVVSVVYLNFVTAMVARREVLVLKRLRTGESSDAEILAGTAAPAVAIAWGQILIGLFAAVTGFGLRMPTNPALVVAAIMLGTAVFGLLASVSTVLTRTVEMAQVITMPVLLAWLLLRGLMFPLMEYPSRWRASPTRR
jgi:ABC-2 type transport system permease protein